MLCGRNPCWPLPSLLWPVRGWAREMVLLVSWLGLGGVGNVSVWDRGKCVERSPPRRGYLCIVAGETSALFSLEFVSGLASLSGFGDHLGGCPHLRGESDCSCGFGCQLSAPTGWPCKSGLNLMGWQWPYLLEAASSSGSEGNNDIFCHIAGSLQWSKK